jgi:hypothetical protein
MLSCSDMNPRHAAALALVGWYLMAPPPQADPTTGLPNGAADVRAPFKYWDNEGSFDSAKECSSNLESNIRLLMQVEANMRSRHLSERQESAEDEKVDQAAKLPRGWSYGLRYYGLAKAIGAQCIATDDPRLKEK